MKVIDTTWVSSLTSTGVIGFVVVENDMGKRTARVGLVGGMNVDQDIQRIIQYGSKFSLEQAEKIVGHLKPEK